MTPSPKEKCPFHRNGSGPLAVGSAPCLKLQQEKKGNCLTCKHYQPPPAAQAQDQPPAAQAVQVVQPKTTAAAPAVQGGNMSVQMPTLTGLHNELFKQLKRLNDDELKGDDLKREVERSHAVTSLSQTMINNASLVLKAHLGIANSVGTVTMPALITREDPTGRDS